jgi:hypothetical protein
VFSFNKGQPEIRDRASDVTLAEAKRQAQYLNLPTTYNIPAVCDPASGVPGYVALDRVVLRFNGFFKEAVHESRNERYRVRQVVLYYYLEDDTIRIDEPKTENAALPQGAFLKRHKVPKPDGVLYSVKDLRLGEELTIYGRTMVLCNCDDFTRAFYEQNEMWLGTPVEVPIDPYTDHIAQQKAQKIRVAVKPGQDPLRQFLAFDRKVLRFYCYWDDRPNMFGSTRQFMLHYFLADDTIEVNEKHVPNSGRDPFPSMVKRTRLPRVFSGLKDLELSKEQCYNLTDLVVGETINVFGRPLLLYDCDPFTRDYYRVHLGIEQGQLTEEIKDPIGLVPHMPVPPHTGYGGEEDSLSSYYHLVPKPPLKDLEKMNKFDGRVLRWAVRLDTDKPEDVDRRFVLAMYLTDDSISVYEPSQRNSGFIGGKFMERQRVKRIDNPSEYYRAKDILVGEKIQLGAWKFVVIDADMYTQKFFASREAYEPRPPEVVIREFKQAMHKRNVPQEYVRKLFSELDTDGSGYLEKAEIETMLVKMGFKLKEDDLLSLLMAFDSTGDGKINYEEFCQVLES